MDFQDLIFEKRGMVAWVTLNRPQVLNALSKRLVGELVAAFDEVERDPDLRVAVLTGAGRAFSAGYDIKEEVAENITTASQWRDVLAADIRMTWRVWELSKPVIAAVHSYCLGGACELAMMCDLVLAAEDASFGEPEVRYGSGPVTLIMPWVVGLRKAKELLYTGDVIDAREAERIGMVNRVVPRDRLEPEAMRWAEKLAKVPPEVMRLTKAPLNRAFEAMGLREAVAYNLEAGTIVNSLQTPEQVEFHAIARDRGLKAALEWRDSRYQERLAEIEARRART